MIKITFGQLRDRNFNQAMGKLVNFTGFTKPSFAYNVAKIHKAVLAETEIVDEVFKKFIEPFAVRDKAGAIKPSQGIPGTFDVIESMHEEYKTKVTELLANTVEIPCSLIALGDLEGARMSPLELASIDFLLHAGLEAVK